MSWNERVNNWASGNPKKLFWVLIFSLLGLLIVVVIGLNAWGLIQRAPFEGRLTEFASIHPRSGGSSSGVRGKLVVIDKATGQLDPVWGKIPDNMRAANPADVGTVVWLSWSESLVGRYKGGQPAYRSDVKVTVIDRASSTVLDTKTFSNEPPGTITAGGGGGASGKRPEDEVVNYLRTLAGVSQPSRTQIIVLIVGLVPLAIGVIFVTVLAIRRHDRPRAAA